MEVHGNKIFRLRATVVVMSAMFAVVKTGCQTVIRQLSVVFRQSSECHQLVVRQSSGSYQAVIRWLSLVRHLSGIHQVVAGRIVIEMSVSL